MNAERTRVLKIDMKSAAFKQNPFPTLARLLEHGPLIRTRIPIGGKIWLATTYDSVNDLLRDHGRFLQNPASAGNRLFTTIFRWMPRSLQPLMSNMLLRDEPDHRRLRSLVEQAFLRRSVDEMRPRLEALAAEAADQLAEAAKNSPRGVDLIDHFARPFPLAVICELLGLPPEDRPQFTQWVSGVTASNGVLKLAWGVRRLGRLTQYIRDECRRQAQHPRGGLLSALIDAEEAGSRLTEDELVAMVFLLLVAGHETTLHQISSSVLAFLDHPPQRAEFMEDPRVGEPAVQELLRYVSLAQITKPRFAREDTEFYGQQIRRGEPLFGCLASANADPSRFPHPERLDFQRGAKGHVAFGAGIHACLGAKLARVELELALRLLFERCSGLRLAVPRSEIKFTGKHGMRALATLPVLL